MKGVVVHASLRCARAPQSALDADTPEVVDEAEKIADIIVVCDRTASERDSVVGCMAGGCIRIVTGEGLMLLGDGGGAEVSGFDFGHAILGLTARRVLETAASEYVLKVEYEMRGALCLLVRHVAPTPFAPAEESRFSLCIQPGIYRGATRRTDIYQKDCILCHSASLTILGALGICGHQLVRKGYIGHYLVLAVSWFFAFAREVRMATDRDGQITWMGMLDTVSIASLPTIALAVGLWSFLG